MWGYLGFDCSCWFFFKVWAVDSAGQVPSSWTRCRTGPAPPEGLKCPYSTPSPPPKRKTPNRNINLYWLFSSSSRGLTPGWAHSSKSWASAGLFLKATVFVIWLFVLLMVSPVSPLLALLRDQVFRKQETSKLGQVPGVVMSPSNRVVLNSRDIRKPRLYTYANSLHLEK